MIDSSDGDFALLMSNGGGCAWTVVCLVLAGILYYAACVNEADCASQTCPRGGTVKLLDHECVCVEAPVGGSSR